MAGVESAESATSSSRTIPRWRLYDLNRQWIGIDVTYIAVDLIAKRLEHTYGKTILDTFDMIGNPKDVTGAKALFSQSPPRRWISGPYASCCRALDTRA